VLENRVMKRISEQKGEEVTRGWRKLPNGELHNSIPSLVLSNQEWLTTYSMHGRYKKSIQNLM
jgi:hypothetical protein